MKKIVITFFVLSFVIEHNLAGRTADKEPSTPAELQAMQLKQADRSREGPHNPHPDAQWFPGAGLGLFIHWGIAAIRGDGDLSWSMLANKPWVDGTAITPNAYWGLTNGWKTDQMDFDKMLGAAKAAGFTYAVMVTKHHDGFTFWPSEFGDIGTAKTFDGRDFVQEYVAACRKHGLKVGFYYSPPDWRFDRLYRSFSWAGPALDMDHKPVNLPPKPAEHNEARRKLVQGQLRELLTRYGKIDLIWFDGGQGEMPNADVRNLQPGIVINMRNGRGDYGDSESSLPDKRFNGWFEACLPCWPKRSWSYNKNYGGYDAATTLTMTALLRAWGGNLLANVGPKGDGSLPDNTMSCWSEMAQWMSHSREALVGTKAGPWPDKVNLPVTVGDDAAYIHFLPKLSEKVTGLPPEVKDWTSMRKIIKNYPWDNYSTTAVWNDAPTPVEVTLLRTGDKIPFSYENHTLTVTIPENLRTSSVDVVRVRYAVEPGNTGATGIEKPLLKECGLMEGPDGLVTRAPNSEPSAAQKWQIANTRYGMFIHYGINTFINQEWSDGTVPVEKYAPKEIHADEWVLAAKNAGMSHVVLICKHHDGFCNWPTKVDEAKYSVAHTANPTDVVKAVSDACRKHGMHFAIYYSLWDRRWDGMHAEDYKKNAAATDIAYTDFMIAQLRELLTQYGDVTELWFDGPWQKTPERWHYDRVYDAIKRCQPRCQVAINWCIGDPRQAHLAGTIHPGNQKAGDYIRYFPCDFRLGDPYLPSNIDPKVFTRDNHSYYMPFESTVCLNNKWFWNESDLELKSVKDLEQLYRQATANDNMLLLNAPPGPDGRMRAETIKRLVELRDQLGLRVGGPGWNR